MSLENMCPLLLKDLASLSCVWGFMVRVWFLKPEAKPRRPVLECWKRFIIVIAIVIILLIWIGIVVVLLFSCYCYEYVLDVISVRVYVSWIRLPELARSSGDVHPWRSLAVSGVGEEFLQWV